MRKASLAILTHLALAAGAIAQAAAGGPPVPKISDSPKTWLYYLIIAVLAGVAVAISIMPAKRGHMD